MRNETSKGKINAGCGRTSALAVDQVQKTSQLTNSGRKRVGVNTQPALVIKGRTDIEKHCFDFADLVSRRSVLAYEALGSKCGHHMVNEAVRAR